jgi:hypothetical protein
MPSNDDRMAEAFILQLIPIAMKTDCSVFNRLSLPACLLSFPLSFPGNLKN